MSDRPQSFHHRPRQLYLRLGDIVDIHGGRFAGEQGRVIRRSPAGVYVTIPGQQLPVFIVMRHLLEEPNNAQ
jgi:ribosomal protein L24